MNFSSSIRAAASILFVGVVSGCAPSLSLVSPAPPDRVISINREHETIEISEGVAVAVDCSREGGPCTGMRAVSTSPEVASIFPAHIASVSRGYGYVSDANKSSLALVGMKPGTTTIKVWSEGHTSEYKVTVLAVDGVTKGGVVRAQ